MRRWLPYLFVIQEPAGCFVPSPLHGRRGTLPVLGSHGLSQDTPLMLLLLLLSLFRRRRCCFLVSEPAVPLQLQWVAMLQLLAKQGPNRECIVGASGELLEWI